MPDIDLNSQSIQSYLSILQGVINRMAANSSACKTWCVALVSAVIVILADKERPEFVWVSIVPIALFLFLDAYYLGLERQFRDLYDGFIKKLHGGTVTVNDVFIVKLGSPGRILLSTFLALFSISVCPFYGLLGAMLIVVRFWVLGDTVAHT